MISAEGLENVRMFGGRMRTFALLFTNLDVNSSVSTQIDRDGGCNPVWNEKLQVRILGGLHVCYLNIEIYCMTSFGKPLAFSLADLNRERLGLLDRRSFVRKYRTAFCKQIS